MFSTTVRENLDPFTVYTDDEIWDALEKCRMKTVVQNLKLKLKSKEMKEVDQRWPPRSLKVCTTNTNTDNKHCKVLVSYSGQKIQNL